ncbi:MULTISPECIES: serine hydrolase domain-containing protein [unclassified Streptomyces]|uniref:serine hydrolase domain-containing protein n=1 Tax=unclassified Streptomyces TaxID=2593676 RepID=UPI00081ED608|nr:MULTISPECIES: serine hydrolase domain-containing protein [unclassified Streptomyces]MYR30653.1 serine hydrolase [Streptomyces sp. SID4945]SCD50431.1 D-alanyl-D-alanine carboxypeptidase [Streptomyces sp. TverLS-915]SCF50312.1 D-alanyl-D-alanine carboxypeptidase [Streptomyces sp. LcepLS]
MALATCVGAALVSCSDASSDGAGVAAGQSAASPAADARLARLAQQAADTGSLGVIVRVDSGDGKPVEIAKQAAWTKDDHTLAAGDQFRVGSNTKTVTATLVLQQVAENKISLDDTVEKWLPGVVKNGNDITVRMLLNHTSGLGDFLLTPEFLPSLTGQEKRTWRPQELLAITPEQDPPAEPGETYSYSNANYEALGLILEKATGSSLAELIKEKITGPLKMNDSYLATDADWSTGRQHVTGYEPNAERLKEILSDTVYLPDGVGFAGPERPDDNVDTSAIDPSWSWAAGGMVSTAADWQTFLTALNSGELLPEAQLKQMRTTVDAPEEGGGYGLGLMRVDTDCGTVWGHTGGLPGYSSEIYTDATGTRSVAVFSNTNFGIKDKAAATANKALVEAATCQMLGKAQPSDRPAG